MENTSNINNSFTLDNLTNKDFSDKEVDDFLDEVNANGPTDSTDSNNQRQPSTYAQLSGSPMSSIQILPGLTRKQTLEVMSKKLVKKTNACVLIKKSERVKTVYCRLTTINYLGSLFFSDKFDAIPLNNFCVGKFVNHKICGLASIFNKKKNKLASSITGKDCYGDFLIFSENSSFTKEDFIQCLREIDTENFKSLKF